MAPAPQHLKSHARYVPGYHFALFALLLVLLVRALVVAARHPTPHALFDIGVVVALGLATWYARSFALTVQDRVIRLEMRLRMERVAPQQAARFDAFTPAQLTALRFAGDAELPGLAQRVLDGQLASNAEIKRQVRDWQADHLRA